MTEQSTGQISDGYHTLDDLCHAEVLNMAPPFDGHTSNDVLSRLRQHLLYGIKKND